MKDLAFYIIGKKKKEFCEILCKRTWVGSIFQYIMILTHTNFRQNDVHEYIITSLKSTTKGDEAIRQSPFHILIELVKHPANNASQFILIYKKEVRKMKKRHHLNTQGHYNTS